MADLIFLQPLFTDYVLPFLLVFVLIFAILQKTKLLGDGKRQIDAMIGALIGLILIGFPFSRDLIVNMIPFLAVAAVMLLVIMLLFGFVFAKEKDVLTEWVKIGIVTVILISFVIFFLVIAGWWNIFINFVFGGTNSNIVSTVVFIIVIAGAVIAVLYGNKKSS
jgi:hypothetical protein